MEGQEHDSNLIAAYIEGWLGGEDEARFTKHLASCAECRGTLALMARESDVLGVSAPRSLSNRWAPSLRVWLPMAASLIVIAAVGLRSGWLRSSAPGSRPPGSVGTHPEIAPPGSGEVDDNLLIKRGGERRLAGKTFRLVAGEWRDAAFDPIAGLPIVEVEGPQARSALLSRLPALAPYAELGPRVVVVFEGTVYRLK